VPAPVDAFGFRRGNNPGSINDGFLEMKLYSPDFPDVPGSLHGNTGGFSFADGARCAQEVAHWSASDPGPAGCGCPSRPRRYGEQHGLDLGSRP